MTNSTAFALRMISIPVVAGLLAALWCDSANAAEPTFHATPKAAYGATVNGHKVVFAQHNGKAALGYWTANPGALVAKLPATVHGSCKITERLKTDPATGEQHIRRHTVCKGK